MMPILPLIQYSFQIAATLITRAFLIKVLTAIRVFWHQHQDAELKAQVDKQFEEWRLASNDFKDDWKPGPRT